MIVIEHPKSCLTNEYIAIYYPFNLFKKDIGMSAFRHYLLSFLVEAQTGVVMLALPRAWGINGS